MVDKVALGQVFFLVLRQITDRRTRWTPSHPTKLKEKIGNSRDYDRFKNSDSSTLIENSRNLRVSARFITLQPLSLLHAWDAVLILHPSHRLATPADQYCHHHPPLYPQYSHPRLYPSLSLYRISFFTLIHYISQTKIILSLSPTFF
jgi:hypothetical protein